ncbi:MULTISPECIES: HAD family hydrolase [unclassified Clostridioides]|uniref:HAD family hydrolase n=1 Tax=unclassified Clostridioides TaxID=2635829 RepID=UPI001D0C24DE|nr:HAD family hydrolase [Clostridioides sp. ES-S-0001-02]MCC0639277.1 HAD family hydrolase [Clostridioides sp. ES-S-0049-03]MCC0653018.1 HAD family hydrolase [Clostridioides sp. ES-S-0001-03]MCC0656998.1 HAD family hydrolase [Clostridioides sp. ES-S-0123-01]MCC0675667.1 HAD family hydrolase [Clostridioides sp. ES-W-0018-02]MCC0695431.1 HAD family hydrolase [Clostridioides sp. ES-S-0048-02]MCC0709524.1 HAD family hydrolase [Clostridioides sp. ES-W-0017-02]MCC0761521.1 HAD family hydrolase [Cl
MIDSIIFDLDGTLWDSTEGVCKVWQEVLDKREDIGLNVTVELFRSVMGLSFDEIAKRFFPDLDEEERMNILDECSARECDYLSEYGGKLFEDIENTLGELSKKYKLFIVSNCQKGYIESFLKAHKLENYFIDFECPGNTGLHKGENNKLIIDRNKLTNPIYIGDTQGDANSAKFAGIPFVYAKYGFGNVDEYDYSIESFKDLLEHDILK